MPFLGEDFRLSISKSLKEFAEDDGLQEFSFPASLSNIERKFVHELSQQMGLKSKSSGKGSDRFLTVSKKSVEEHFTFDKYCHLDFSDQETNQKVQDFLRQNPLNSQDLQLLESFETSDKSHVKSATGNHLTGKLTQAVPQVPDFQGPCPSYANHAENLPIFPQKSQILESINKHQITIISGETGSGKTTQVPQYLLQNAQVQGSKVRIIVTEPRRIAAVTVSERVAAECGVQFGSEIGYQIRLESNISHKTVCTFCTNGVLLRTLMGSLKTLENVTHVIVDEIHERDKFSDFLLAVLRQAMTTYPNLKLILMSATMETQLFDDYFKAKGLTVDIIQVPGRMFPVEEFYLEDVLAQLPGYVQKPAQVLEASAEADEELDEAIEMAFRYGDFEDVYRLIFEEKSDINYMHSSTGVSALMAAAGHGDVDVIKDLIAANAKLDLVSKSNGWTALDFARCQSHVQAAELLENCNPVTVLSEDKKSILESYFRKHDDNFIDFELLRKVILWIDGKHDKNHAILVFLPGYEDLVKTKELLDHDSANLKICLLHSQLSCKEQKQAFGTCPHSQRKVILATNIAETSLTINDVSIVIDCGKVKEKSFDSLSGTSSLQTDWISQNSATQRKGRAGRTRPGLVVRLYSRQRYEHFDLAATPEILRTPLSELCLQTKLLAASGVKIEEFLSQVPEAPSPAVIKSSVNILKAIQALDAGENLTLLGQHLLDIPIEPLYGKMILAALAFRCLNPVLTTVCALSYKSPFELPSNKTAAAALKQARAKFSQNSNSDHLTLNNAYRSWLKAKQNGQAYRFCREHWISNSVMEMIEGMRLQILTQLKKSQLLRDYKKVNENSNHWNLVKAALAMATYPNLARLDREACQLRTKKEFKVRLHPSCQLSKTVGKGPVQSTKMLGKMTNDEWFVYDEMTKTGRVAAIKTVTSVSSLMVALFSGPMTMTNAQWCESDENQVAIELTDWLCFEGFSDGMEVLLQLRQKWFAYFISMLKWPNEVKRTSNQEYDLLLNMLAKIFNSQRQVGNEGQGRHKKKYFNHH